MIKEFLSKGRQRSMVLVSFLMFAAAVFAVPAKPGITRLLTLTDGTTVTATLAGDEFAHYWIDSNGHAYQSVSGDVYQMIDLQAVKQHAAKRRAAANQRRMRRLASRRIGEVGGVTGDKKGLIILVNFSDVKFDDNHNNDLFQDIANKENFTSGNFKGSMYDYFKAQSDGKFLLTFDVVGPVDISKPQAYYGENKNGERGEDLHAAEMVIEALQKVDSEVNFANYDWDGDKEVEQVYVVYAGKGEADYGAANTIWPHEYDLASAKYFGDGTGPQILDGVKINTYACGSELNGSGNICGIGTMCHEFSHCLGYPDYYDTDYSGGQGMGQWDLMCSGSYNGNGYQPAGYTSYERWVAGWKTPVTLETTQTVSNMKALQTKNSDTYIIYNKGNNNEYYLLENRQKTGWDASLPGAGLLILHVDYDKNAWSNNNPNDDPDHQRMTWIPADNDYNSNPANDPFPYGSVNAFGKNTTPAAKLYNKNSDGSYYLDCSIKNITQNSDGTVTFDFNGESNLVGAPAAPVWSALPANVSVTIGEDYELMVSDYVSGIPAPTITMTSSDSDDADFDDGYFLFIPTTAGTFNFTFRATNTEGYAKATLTVTVPAPPAGKEFTLVTSANDFVEGDYIIVYNNGAMNTTVSNNRLQYTEVTPNSDVITTDDASIIWHIKPSGNYYTIYNAKEKKYAAGTGTKSQAQLLDSDTDDKALWSVTKGTTFDFTNKYNSSKNVNATLRRNGTYGFACYASGTGGKLSLYKCPTPLLLANDGDNSSAIAAAANGGKYDVTLNNRTLYKDGSWNTLCLPFDISSAELDDADHPLHGSTIMALDVESKEDDGQTPKTRLASDGTLYLYFQTVYDYFFPSAGLTAGTPYLVKWAKADGYDQASENTRDLKNPVFSGVSIKNATTEVSFTGGKFKGLFSPENFTANDKSILYFGAGNKLHWPNANMTLGACRAYFLLNDGNEARDFVVIFNDNEATGIASHLLPLAPCHSEWYDLSGRKLNGKPTQKGLYIHNGRKTVIK